MTRMIAFLISTAVTAHAPTDPFERAVVALQQGSAARTHHNARGIENAIETLNMIGAHNDGVPGFAENWRAKGRSKRAAPPAYRERVLGPGYRLVVLPSGGSAQFDQIFLAGQRARIAVVPLERGGFGLAVRDEDGPVCVVPVNSSACDWIPVATSRVRIELKNRATAKASFYIVVR
jgi:hypothetical protein